MDPRRASGPACGLLLSVLVLLLVRIEIGRAESPNPTPCLSVLLLDLDGDGLFLSDESYPVEFDLDGDGVSESTTWTASGQNEAFLWRDRDRNTRLDGAHELACGGRQENDSAFDRLRRYDSASDGGNEDGWLDAKDPVFEELRLWVDSDHDGQASPREVGPPGRWEITAINLGSVDAVQVDGNLNLHTAISTYRRQEIGVGPIIEVRLRRLP